MEGLTIDSEIQRLMRPLTDDERQALHESLARDGCREPLCIWRSNGTAVLLDGHHRYEWLSKHGEGFDVFEVPNLESRGDAIRWVARNQRARRNCTPEELAYIRGERYILERKEEGRPKRSHSDSVSEPERTAERIAEEDGVGAATVYRDASFAEAVDAVAEVSPEAKTAILSGRSKATKKTVRAVAALPKKERAEAAKKIAAGEPVSVPEQTKTPKPKPAPGRTASKSEITQAKAIVKGVSAIAATMRRAGLLGPRDAQMFSGKVAAIIPSQFADNARLVCTVLDAMVTA